MARALTDTQIRALKAAEGKRVEAFDAQEPGLMLRVSDQGKKTWFFRYRLEDGRQPRFKLGTYPATPIADARRKANDARRIVEAGGDPAGEQRLKKAKAQAQPIRTFGDLTAAYFAACRSGTYKPKGKPKSASTIKSEEERYARHIKKALDARPFGEVGRAEIKAVSRAMLANGITTQANHAHALIRQVFSFALEEELIATNPAMTMASPAPKRARERVLTDGELKALWSALKSPAGLTDAKGEQIYLGRAVGIALQLVTLLLQRRIEVAGMRKDELDLTLATWTIPGERTKNGRPHSIPLPPASITLLKEALEIETQGKSPFVFPSPRSAHKPIGADALTRAMGSAMKAMGFPLAGPHDLRRTGASALASERLGIMPFVVSQVLNHTTDAGGGSVTTRRHYNVHAYAVEKRRALEAWEALLLEIVGEKPRLDNVTPMRSAQ